VYVTPAVDAPGAVSVEVVFKNGNDDRRLSAGRFIYTNGTTTSTANRRGTNNSPRKVLSVSFSSF
jgi:hypothetical protein